ncbi:MAG: hypothetical protein SWH78_06510 [Thermodesulfobacteriota bacterium]|nr:hypothetical protein [Thermodesulfobacteriota bacterium]
MSSRMRRDCRRGSSGRSRVFLLWVVMLTLLLLCPVRGEAGFHFVKIADYDTKIPDALGWFPYFRELDIPVVDGVNVAFLGASATDNTGYAWIGVLLYDGDLEVMANQDTSIPPVGEYSLKFSKFFSPSIDGSNVAFVGVGPDLYKVGVYVNAGDTLWKVADADTDIPAYPGKFNYLLYAFPSADNNNVAFVGANVNYSGESLTINEIGVCVSGNLSSGPSSPGIAVNTSDSIPNSGIPNINFSFFKYPSLNGDSVAFVGAGGTETPIIMGVYTAPLITGPILKVADTTTEIPGEQGLIFARFPGSPSYSGNYVAFLGCSRPECDSLKGIYTAGYDGSNRAKVADTNTVVPGGGGTKFTDLDSPSLDYSPILHEYKLAFLGKSDVETGIYLYDFTDSSLTTIVKTGDKVGGKTVSELGFGAEGLSGPVIGFHVSFTDGTEGIYQAGELVPWGSGGGPPLGSTQSAPLRCTLCAENMGPRDPYLFSIALGKSGLGIDEPLWIDPDYAIGYDYAVEGSDFASVTPPVDIDPDNTFDLFLFDSGSGDFVDTGHDLTGGATFSFSDNGFNDVNKFSIRGISMAPNLSTDDPNFPHLFPVGVTFTDPNTMVEIIVTPVVASGDFAIDIKPGSWPNCINPNSGGVVSVAILGNDLMDVNDIDPATVTLEGVLPLRWVIEDVDNDGFNDLVFKFKKKELADKGVLTDGGSLTLEGQLADGTEISGSDTVFIPWMKVCSAPREASLTRGWDDFSHPLTTGTVCWAYSFDGATATVTLDLAGAKPDYQYRVGLYIFNEDDLVACPDVSGPGILGPVPGVEKEGNTACVAGMEIGTLTTDALGNGMATSEVSLPSGEYSVQLTVHGDENCPRSDPLCNVVYRTGNAYADGFERLIFP